MDLMTTFAVQLPMCIVLGAGCVVAVVSWRKHPKVSALACMGSGGLLLLTMMFYCVGDWLPHFSDVIGVEHRIAFTAFRIVNTLGGAAAYAALLFAVFLGRSGGGGCPVA